MTLVLSVASPDFCVQVSDRRVVYLPDFKLKDDLAIKAIAYFNSMAWGYSGWATVEGRRTDLWMCDQLKMAPSASPLWATRMLLDGANRALRAISYSHTFMGVGWGKEEGGPLCPRTAFVSNCHTSEGRLLSEPQPTFAHRVALQPKGATAVAWSGVELTGPEKARIVRGVRRIFGHRAGQRAVMRWLSNQIREVSGRLERQGRSVVGRDLLAICLPVDPVQKVEGAEQAFIFKGEPREGHASFHDLREGGPIAADGYPHIVGPGYVVSLKGWEVTPNVSGGGDLQFDDEL
ncbi:MAG TPA: hypothetical protein VKB18_04195 [Gemmatimonadota bacterium]|nr:hypothetical protein [Gemmatimonadota bacterium]